MIEDILTVVWKERKGLFRFRGSRTRFMLTLLTPVLLAVVFPLQMGLDWLEEAPAIVLSAVVPVILVGVTIPESFAGERERHTLETLLASRLPDRAILIGKMAVSVAFAWGTALAVLFVGLAMVNIANWEDRILWYTPPIALGGISISFLMATVCAGLGVIISMRSRTVQEAAQLLMAIFLVPPMILQVVLFALVDRLSEVIDAVNGPLLLVIVLAVLAVADAVVLVVAVSRFRRSRLCLG